MPPDTLHVLHLIERLTLGGAGRSLIAAAAASKERHRVFSLRPPDMRVVAMARSNGIAMADPDRLAAEIEASDVVHLHFWNSPQLYATLRAGLPPCRTVLTSHVVGNTIPHILSSPVRALCDRVIATTPDTPADWMIPAAADFRRLHGIRIAPRTRFTIGYIGALDFSKLHPDFVAMHQGLGGEFEVHVAGDGPARPALQAQAQRLGLADRFRWLGHVEDVGGLLGCADVFGYPLRQGTFATTELVLHEAMYAGVPLVLLADGGARHSVVDGVTGFQASNPEEYVERLRMLRDDPVLRRRLGAQAAEYARAHLGADRLAPRIDAAYSEVSALPKSGRALAPVTSGTQAWLQSLGEGGTDFIRSLAGDARADAAIRGASPAVASADAGGVLHYRRVYPEDAALRFWSGLVLLGMRRFALAAGEFKAAGILGFDAVRSDAFLREAIDRAAADHQ